GGSVFVEALLRGVQGVLGDADQRGEIPGGQAGADPGVEDEEPLLGRQRRPLGGWVGDEPFAVAAATSQPRRVVGAVTRLIAEFVVAGRSCGWQLLGSGRDAGRRGPGGGGTPDSCRVRVKGGRVMQECLPREKTPRG